MNALFAWTQPYLGLRCQINHIWQHGAASKDNLFKPALDTTIKFVILRFDCHKNFRLRGNNWSQIMPEYCNKYFKETYSFESLLESPQWGDSNIYPKHIINKEIKTKQDISYILICSLSILYNSKFILIAMSSETNAVVVRGFTVR